MKWPKFNRRDLVISLSLVIAYLVLRLTSLTIFPIFTDEAIYLRWAQIAKNDAAWRFISLTDGKQPLFVWCVMVAMKLISDPLIAGRLISVFFGLISLVAIWCLAYSLFSNKKISFLASFLYLISPFALVYDRMALMDTMVGTFALTSLFLAVILVKKLRLDVAFILSFSLGGGILTKSSGFFNIYLLPFTLLLFNWQKEKRWSRLLKWGALVLIAIIVSQIFYGVLRLSPHYHMITQKDTTFIYPFHEWIKRPLVFFRGNLNGELDWLSGYFTHPWLFLILISFFFKEKWREKTLLFSWFLPPFVALALFGKVLYPRFIFFMSVPLLVLVAYSLFKFSQLIKNSWLFLGVSLLFIFYPLFIDYQLLFNPVAAYIPHSDKDQYIASWPAGIGIKELNQFFQEESEKQPIFVATEGTFGMFPAAIELYHWQNQNMEIKGYWPVSEIPQEVIQKSKELPTFFVFNETRKFPPQWPIELVAEYPKIQIPFTMRLFKVLPDQDASL